MAGHSMTSRMDLSRACSPGRTHLSGGFANDRMPDGSVSGRPKYRLCSLPGALLPCRRALERDACRLPVSAWALRFSDGVARAFFFDRSRSFQKPTTEFPPEKQFWYMVENQVARQQCWTIGGIAAAFLCRLYLAEPRAEYLELAHCYQAFSMAATERQFDYGPVCKSGWGSSLLYLITGKPEYEAWTYRMSDWFVEYQHPDEGHWHSKTSVDQGSIIHNALEFVMQVDTIMAGLSSRPITPDR